MIKRILKLKIEYTKNHFYCQNTTNTPESLKTGNKEKNEEFDFFFITLSLSADLQGIYISYSKKNERSEKNMTWHTQ